MIAALLFATAVEARALHLVALLRDSRARDAEAELAELKKCCADDPWTAYAVAESEVSEHPRAALTASEKLAGIANDDFVLLRAKIFRSLGRPAEAIRVIDETLPYATDKWPLIVAKASAITDLDQALPMYAEARAAEPQLVEAWQEPGVRLLFRKRAKEALPLLQQAATLSNEARIAQMYWRALRESGGAFEAAIHDFLDRHPHAPDALYFAERAYEQAGKADKAKKMHDRLMAEFPDSGWADSSESVRLARCIRTDRRCRAEGEAFVERPHQVPETIDTVRNMLLEVWRDDPAVPSERVYALVRAMQERDTYPLVAYVNGPIALADRRVHLAEAEQMPLKGLRLELEQIDDAGDPPDDAAKQRHYVEALVHDALGWVYTREGKFAAAQRELDQAVMLEPRLGIAEYHRGKLAEARHLPEEAAQDYVAGMAKLARGGPDPNRPALEHLYRSRHGSLRGFDAYVERLKSGDSAKRKERILAARPSHPKPVPTFSLHTLDGHVISSGDLRGHTTVINFWGIWCVHCVAEMPELAALARDYRGAHDVQILTINNDNDAAKVRRWMAEKQYDFPVLLDDGWLAKSGVVTTFPTTWFIDRDGRLAWEAIGETKELRQEFSWRIEAMQR